MCLLAHVQLMRTGCTGCIGTIRLIHNGSFTDPVQARWFYSQSNIYIMRCKFIMVCIVLTWSIDISDQWSHTPLSCGFDDLRHLISCKTCYSVNRRPVDVNLFVLRVIKLCYFFVSVAYGIKRSLKLALLITLITGLFHVGNTLTVNLERQNLTVVPRDLNISVNNLLLRGNHITEFNNVSFNVYLELELIMAELNGLRYIREGTFDENAKLKKLGLMVNSIIQLPTPFGAGGKSIEVLLLRNALQGPAISKLNLSEMGRLQRITLGKNDCNGTLDAM